MQDILLNSDFTLAVKDGDFVIGDSDIQQQELLLICNKGSFKEHPDACVGLCNYLEAEDPADLIAEVKAQFKADGMQVNSVQIKNGKLIREAFYQ